MTGKPLTDAKAAPPALSAADRDRQRRPVTFSERPGRPATTTDKAALNAAIGGRSRTATPRFDAANAAIDLLCGRRSEARRDRSPHRRRG
jgi:hypothetical protein